jgi:hypothetical protein
MGTTQKTTQTAQYDPTSKGVYEGLQGGLGSMLGGYMNNPFGNPFFQTQQQMGQRQAQNIGGANIGNLTRNLTASGFGGGGATSPFAMEMLQNQARANTGLGAQLGFLNPVQNALGMQQWAGGLASGYRPLQTGQTDVKSTGGLGTWLPQVAGLALAPFTGGLSMLGAQAYGHSPWGTSSPGAQGFNYGGAYNSPFGGMAGLGASLGTPGIVPGQGFGTPGAMGGGMDLGMIPPPPFPGGR